MSNILEHLTQQLSGSTLSNLSSKLGAPPEKTGKAVEAALPMILGSLARNAQNEQGAQALDRALERDHDGGLFEQLRGGGLDASQLEGLVPEGNGILKHVLGDRRNVAETGVSRVSGLDSSSTSQLLSMLAPMVMGMLGNKKREEGLDARDLSDVLGRERQQVEATKEGGGLLSFLDSDGDGSILDDVAGSVGKRLLGGLFGR